jgi:protein SCO1/2
VTARAVGRAAAIALVATLLRVAVAVADTPGTGSGAGDAALSAGGLPAALEGVRFDQRLGGRLPLEARFRDEQGRDVRLGDFFRDRPVVLSLGYYRCPMLCPMVREGLVRSIKPLAFSTGRDFEVVVASIDPDEGPEDARASREATLARYDRAGSEDGWHFLTGPAESIAQLSDAIGFRYRRDPESGQFAHAAGVVVATPSGEVSRYLFGAEFAPKDARLALVESSESRIGSWTDQVLLFCFHYDPTAGRYSAVALGSIRAAGILTVLALAGFIGLSFWRERRA